MSKREEDEGLEIPEEGMMSDLVKVSVEFIPSHRTELILLSRVPCVEEIVVIDAISYRVREVIHIPTESDCHMGDAIIRVADYLEGKDGQG